jgi:DNA processing protein
MNQDEADRLAYLTLALVPGIGRVRFDALLDEFGSPDAVLMASQRDLGRVAGISRAAATAIRTASYETGTRVVESVRSMGGAILLREDREFPAALRDIPEAPTILFGIGKLGILQRPAVGIVGSRDHSPYGAKVCVALAEAAARVDLVVVSGMARGLDAVAHRAALDAGGASVGVLGNGLGIIYPSANRKLYEQMTQNGCLITEYGPGERPHAGSFPRRNRLISGLAAATVVVEARRGSGALITAECALRQGREVMAVPGPITSSLSEGTNHLIQMGAKPVTNPRDMLEEYNVDPDVPQVSLPSDLSELERRVIELLADGVSHVDDLTARIACEVTELLATMTSLEIRGLVVQETRMQYALNRSFAVR